MIRDEMVKKARDAELARAKCEQKEEADRVLEDLLKDEEEKELKEKREAEKRGQKKAKGKEKKDQSGRLEKERVCEEERDEEEHLGQEQQVVLDKEKTEVATKFKLEKEAKHEKSSSSCRLSAAQQMVKEAEEKAQRAGEDLLKEEEEVELTQKRKEEKKAEKKTKTKEKKGAPGAASDTDKLASCHKIGADFKGESTQEKAPMSANALSAEAQFLAKFNLGDSDGGGVSVAVTVADQPHVRGGMNRLRFTYSALSQATNQFDKRLGGGGFGSVFQGILASGTLIAVKRLEIDPALGPAGGLPNLDEMLTEVHVLSHVQHPNIVQLLGSSMDGYAPCLVYALMEGGSLQDRLECSRVGDLALTANERILVLSDVARGLAFLHSEVKIIHRDVKSANVLLDRNCVGRIGDFGICKAATDKCGVTATHLQTKNVVGTLLYMSPEYKNGDLSFKVDTFAFGLVVLEALTGYSIHEPAPGHRNLLGMFDDEFDSADKLLAHLDKRASWELHTAHSVPALHSIADRCLEMRCKRRPEIVALIPELEEVQRSAEVLASAAKLHVSDRGECVVCLGKGLEVEGWMMLRPCGHVCVCRACCVGIIECPMCRSVVSESLPVFL